MIEPKDWNEIYDGTETDGIPQFEEQYMTIPNDCHEDCVRFYKGDTYFRVDGGWVELSEVITHLNDTVGEREIAKGLRSTNVAE